MNYKGLVFAALLLPSFGYGSNKNDARTKQLIEERNLVTVRLAATSALLLSNILKEFGLAGESIDSLTAELEDCQKEIIRINKEYKELTK